MQREPVQSRALRAIGYDAASETLEIEFSSGRVYRYSSVPASVHEWLLRSPDKGGLFNRLIRDRYAEAEVTPVAAPPDLEALLRASIEEKAPPKDEDE